MSHSCSKASLLWLFLPEDPDAVVSSKIQLLSTLLLCSAQFTTTTTTTIGEKKAFQKAGRLFSGGDFQKWCYTAHRGMAATLVLEVSYFTFSVRCSKSTVAVVYCK